MTHAATVLEARDIALIDELRAQLNEAGDNGTPDLPPNLGGGVAGLFGR